MDDEDVRVTSYDLFVKISKSLALKLPHQKDRVLAAKWIRKIDNLMDLDYPQKSKYLKLISISMQSKILVGPFRNPPPSDDFDIQELYNLKPVDIKDMIAEELKHVFEAHPYHAEISNDLKEYVVVQEIPEFGTHFYYASSLEPITQWRNHNMAILPHGALESSVIIPPSRVISLTKEEFVENYNAYMEKFNKGNKRDACECKPKCPSKHENICEDACQPPEDPCAPHHKRSKSKNRRMRSCN